MNWLSWLLPGRNRARPVDAPSHAATPVRIEPVDDACDVIPVQSQARPALPWLLGCGPLTDTPITLVERSALDTLSRLLAQPEIPDNLLPRAAALIPQLIALVRQTELPTQAIADRIGKDAVLAAEVMRLASSPYYRLQGEVNDLEQAIQLIGLQGLQTVIARVCSSRSTAPHRGRSVDAPGRACGSIPKRWRGTPPSCPIRPGNRYSMPIWLAC
ncbi:MAG: HDOD domain-containing protein, partial [Burkholderiaceae bacterium]